VNGNQFINNWSAGQAGSAQLSEDRPVQSGNTTVTDDLTFTNNVFTNVPWCFNIGALDDICNNGGNSGYTKCTNNGESRRALFRNNLCVITKQTASGSPLWYGANMTSDHTDSVWENNTFLASDGGASMEAFSMQVATGSCQYGSYKYGTQSNIWWYNNVVNDYTFQCGNYFVSGNTPYAADTWIRWYMGAPDASGVNDIDTRIQGNIFYNLANESLAWVSPQPPNNYTQNAQSGITFDGNSQLTAPTNWVNGTSTVNYTGRPWAGSGMYWPAILAAQSGATNLVGSAGMIAGKH